MTQLILIRHGETDWNRDRRIQGSTDIPLNDTGRQQAQEAALHLRETLDARHPIVVAASDLSRARETAEIIAAELGAAAPRLYPALRERSYGEAEGIDSTEFAARWGDWHTAEVPGAEPWADLRSRALTGIRTVVDDARRATGPGAASVVLVSHGALIREVLRHASAGAYPVPGQRLANGSAHPILFERDRLTMLTPISAVA
ncbi:histidine phosphatase family protein [Microbacterium sp. CJ88]|uniref:histidine phosphatase family protein n=1 Tax=Microbacterium sp. CJ88 TaxID=3445672 RepID=UPI003F65FBA5